jgi:hypothetical protein
MSKFGFKEQTNGRSERAKEARASCLAARNEAIRKIKYEDL